MSADLLTQQNATIDSQRNQLAQQNSQLEAQRKQIEDLQRQLAALRHQLSMQGGNAGALADQLRRAQEELQRALEEAARMRRELETCREGNRRLQHENASLKERNARLEDALRSLQQECQRQKAACEAEVERLLAELEEASKAAEMAALKKELQMREVMQQEVAKCRAEAQRVEESLKQEIRDLLAKLADCDDRLHRCQNPPCAPRCVVPAGSCVPADLHAAQQPQQPRVGYSLARSPQQQRTPPTQQVCAPVCHPAQCAPPPAVVLGERGLQATSPGVGYVCPQPCPPAGVQYRGVCGAAEGACSPPVAYFSQQ